MQAQRLTIDQLLGMQPLRVPGSQELRPTLLQRAAFARPGGYEAVDRLPFDYNFTKDQDLSDNAVNHLIGRDPGGRLSLWNASTGSTIVARVQGQGVADELTTGTIAMGGADEWYPQHVAGFGAYATRDDFVGVDRDDAALSPQSSYEPTFALTQSEDAGAGGATFSGDNPPTATTGATYDAASEHWLVTRAGFVWYTDDPEDWDNAPVTPIAGQTMHDLDSNGTVVIAVGSNGSIARSTDGGATWADVTPSLTSDTLRAVKGTASHWVAAGGSYILYSTDGGLTWAVAHNESLDDYWGVDHDSSTGMWFVCEGSSNITLSRQSVRTSTDGIDFSDNNPLNQSIYKGIATNNQGTVVTVASSDAAANRTNRIEVSVDSGVTWSSVSPERQGRLYAVAWNGSHFWAVGEKDGDGFILRSSDGVTWADLSDDFGTIPELESIAVGPGGMTIAYAPAEATYVILTLGSGGGTLDAGEYEIVWLVTLPTRAGKLVANMGRTFYALPGSDDNAITVTTPAQPGSGADGLQVEVYVRYAPELTDDATGDAVQEDLEGREFVLAATLDPGSEENLDAPEVNRTLPDLGNVGTLAVAGPTTFHQGRVWAVPADDEDAYGYIGDAEPDMAALGRPMALAYSDLGYLNLTASAFYLNLPLGSSSKITGLIATPNGLMAFGENDAYIIAGDPATGDLQAEPFPDAVGCDDGQQPVVVGGRVFTVWQDRLYLLDGAQARDVSAGVLGVDSQWAVQDVAADVLTNSVMVMIEGDHKILHFDLRTGEWYAGEVWRNGGTLTAFSDEDRLLPNPYDLALLKNAADPGTDLRLVTVDGSEDDEPIVIEWTDIDAGEPLRRDLWREMRIPLDLMDNFGVTKANLWYRAKSSDPALSTQDANYQIGGRLYGEELVFRLPWGVWSRNVSLRLELYADQRVGILPGISIGFVPGSSDEVDARGQDVSGASP